MFHGCPSALFYLSIRRVRRTARLEPTPSRSKPTTRQVNAAWSHWQRSDARDCLAGLGIDPGEPWSLSEITRERLHADLERVIALGDETGTRATTARVRQRERETGDGVETWAVYGHSAWDGPDAAWALFEAVAADGVISDEPFFVLEADLTGSA
ncbi:Acetyltransferase (GNAT) family [Halapricum desulfuricans]|uniref:Acetyltransferase (GNAT) family n=1 Tax=Halapricum desulfuricans TaxID=2841257 RepID=A0A897NH83_9EURY|nr:hypothetical protein [Halapricum desulfuricans]QSG11794.1 Acetyltransferase (GNAT) family [Halapricum desulfuricans]